MLDARRDNAPVDIPKPMKGIYANGHLSEVKKSPGFAELFFSFKQPEKVTLICLLEFL
jgi:hypothetical protein